MRSPGVKPGGIVTTTGGAVMNSSVQNVMDWLQGNMNKSILIQKQEDGDSDTVHIRLSKVGYRDNKESIDGYTNGSALVLHGEGTISSDSEAPLPGDSYVIATGGLSVSNSSQNQVNVTTDRAEYSFSLENESGGAT